MPTRRIIENRGGSAVTFKQQERNWATMTFHCKNYDIENDKCKKLKGECIPARKGCVLEGRMVVSEELEEKINRINAATARTGKSSTGPV